MRHLGIAFLMWSILGGTGVEAQSPDATTRLSQADRAFEEANMEGALTGY